MKQRGGRSLGIIALVLAGAAIPVAAAPLEYMGTALHYHFTLPDGWVQIPNDVIKQTMQDLTKGMREHRPKYTAGFQKAADNFFIYPYMLVQEFSTENMALSDIATLNDNQHKQNDNLQKKSLRRLEEALETVKNMRIGKAEIDSRRNMVLMNSWSEVTNVGPIQSLIVACPGRKGVVQLYLYAQEDDYKTYAPVFEQILDSFAFEKGYESRKPLMAGRPWLRGVLIAVAALSITGAIVSVIFAVANRKRRV